MRVRARVVAACLLITGCATEDMQVQSPTAPPSRAAEIITQLAHKYETADSYIDSGSVKTTFTRLGRQLRVEQKKFQTAFKRGGNFRFEYQADGDPVVVWSDGTNTYTKRSFDAEVVDDGHDLKLALAAVAGTSSGATQTVPNLLLPTLLGDPWTIGMRDLRGPYSETISGHLCWHIDGTYLHADQIDLWIDQQTWLLLRVVRHRHFERGTGHEEFETDTVTDYDGEMNPQVPSTLLQAPDLTAGVTRRNP